MGERVTNPLFCPAGGGWSLSDGCGGVHGGNGLSEDEYGCYAWQDVSEWPCTVSISQSVDLTGVTVLNLAWYNQLSIYGEGNAYIKLFIDDDLIYDATESSPDYPTYDSFPVSYVGVHTIRFVLVGEVDSFVDQYLMECSAIGPDLPPPPVSAFSGTPLSGDAPLSVSFTDESTGTPTAWLWDFGDGHLSGEQNHTHVYDDAGTYTVSLKVTNLGGFDTETKIDYITVTTAPIPTPYVEPIWSLQIGNL